MKNLVLSVSLILLGFSSVSFAKDGSSGCGPGWYVLRKILFFLHFLRSTTNGILAPTVTLGMTFGTSECSKHSIVKKDEDSLQFLAHNFDDLMIEASMGDGKYLSSFSDTFECTEEEKVIFKSALKITIKNYLLKI